LKDAANSYNRNNNFNEIKRIDDQISIEDINEDNYQVNSFVFFDNKI